MDWQIIGGKLTKEYGFKDFKKAMSFVSHVAELAESANHHPDIYLHSYNKVKIMLFSHDANKITGKDKELAAKIDKLYQ